jgi:L-asparaginase / beta-aspartyl-peptidase
MDYQTTTVSGDFMRKVISVIIFSFCTGITQLHAAETASQVVLVIHGGTKGREKIPVGREKEYKDGLEAALKAGYAVLKAKGSSLDATEAAVKVLEDDPNFNAGKGAVLTKEGKVELEASLMDGKTLKAGAVTGVTRVKNPISAARAVMEKTPHVFLGGDAVETLAKKSGLTLVDPSYFHTAHKLKELQEVQQQEKLEEKEKAREESTGTVGAVAIDAEGNLAASTSTGGRVNKMHGRIGDTPIIGASTYADNSTCALSTTGHGEFFIRYVVAYDICALLKYKGLSLAEAVDEVIMKKLKSSGGTGGVILLDPKGNLAMTFNTPGMPRGYVTKDGKIVTRLFNE